MTASVDDADDILQETLFRAWRGLGAFQGRSSFRTWLFQIATNGSPDVVSGRAWREPNTEPAGDLGQDPPWRSLYRPRSRGGLFRPQSRSEPRFVDVGARLTLRDPFGAWSRVGGVRQCTCGTRDQASWRYDRVRRRYACSSAELDRGWKSRNLPTGLA